MLYMVAIALEAKRCVLQLPARGVKGRWERRLKAVSRVLLQTPCGCDIITMGGTINAIKSTHQIQRMEHGPRLLNLLLEAPAPPRA